MRPVATNYPVAWSVRMSVYICVSVVHNAKAVGCNEMPFGGDIDVVPNNILLDRGSVPSAAPHRKERFGDRNLS